MPEKTSIVDELLKLKQLLDSGVLTQEEFDAQKSKIMSADNNKPAEKTKFCKHCGESINIDSLICPKCGRQVEEMKTAPIHAQEQPKIEVHVNNSNVNTNRNVNSNYIGNRAYGNAKNKWVALALCFLLGYLGVHKFYEGKSKMGLIYLFTLGIFGIGWLVDCVILLLKPNPYYV